MGSWYKHQQRVSRVCSHPVARYRQIQGWALSVSPSAGPGGASRIVDALAWTWGSVPGTVDSLGDCLLYIAVQEERQRGKDRNENEVESTSSANEDMPVEKILEAELAVEPKTETYVEANMGLNPSSVSLKTFICLSLPLVTNSLTLLLEQPMNQSPVAAMVSYPQQWDLCSAG